jgi:hypothetical protein
MTNNLIKIIGNLTIIKLPNSFCIRILLGKSTGRPTFVDEMHSYMHLTEHPPHCRFIF